MSIAARDGFIADFKTGHGQLAIIEHQTAVIDGQDTSFDGRTGIAVSRLVTLTRNADGTAVIRPATGVTRTNIGNATHIVSQSDDSLRNEPGDAIPVERLSSRNRNILQNTGTAAPTQADSSMKSVALFRIETADDIRIIPVKPATDSVVR